MVTQRPEPILMISPMDLGEAAIAKPFHRVGHVIKVRTGSKDPRAKDGVS